MTHTTMQEILSTRTGVALCWLGNLSWLIYANGPAAGTLIATDLDLDREGRVRPSPETRLAPHRPCLCSSCRRHFLRYSGSGSQTVVDFRYRNRFCYPPLAYSEANTCPGIRKGELT